SRRRHTRCYRDWSSDVCSSDLAPRREGMDINRNYPYEWAPEGVEPGSGPYPFSEPETRAEAEFWRTHPNINGVLTYHTTSGVIRSEERSCRERVSIKVA